jgi:tRNA U34 2-thiouridine synthase MnmA/TrmU
MNAKFTALGLLSGGLDSILAARLLQEQKQLRVEGVTFVTPFFGPERARAAAAQIGIPLHELDITEAHFAMLRNPGHGYGKNMNPCIDCHALMFTEAAKLLETLELPGFLFSGEVLGQRPMSQNRQSLETVAKESGTPANILRPLSAKLLPPTQPELEGMVDRDMLLDLEGRSRKPQLALAEKWGITDFPNPGGGCLLTDPPFSRRLRDLFDHQDPETITRTDLELLTIGRHVRMRKDLKIIIGRDEKDNNRLAALARETDTLISLVDFPGPSILIPDNADGDDCLLGARVCVTFSCASSKGAVDVFLHRPKSSITVKAAAMPKDEISALFI